MTIWEAFKLGANQCQPWAYFLAFVGWIVLGFLLARVIGRVCAVGNGGSK